MGHPNWYQQGLVLCRPCGKAHRPENCHRPGTRLLCPDCHKPVAMFPKSQGYRGSKYRRAERDKLEVT